MLLERYWNENLESIKRFLEKIHSELIGKTIFIITHRNADPDAIASAIALHEILQKVKIRSYILLPEGMNEISKQVMEKLELGEKYKYSIIDLRRGERLLINIDMLIIVDTNNPEQLGILAHYISEKPFILVDHHQPGKLWRKAYLVISDHNARSTSEIVANIALLWGHDLPKSISTLLLAGILYDTRRFIYATKRTFLTVYNLISFLGADYLKAQSILQHEMPIPEKIARLKAAQRIVIKKIDDLIIAYSHVSAYESSCARAILELGADAAFIISRHKEKIRIVGRAKQSFVRTTGISLGRDLMPYLGELLGGSGGGHDTAGVVEATAKYDFKRIINIVHKALEKMILSSSKQAL
ncbi:MAG: phosphoesterase [Crenarchaeota archaeon]|nr:phosphoesterase [Thermoproteota archaeon]